MGLPLIGAIGGIISSIVSPISQLFLARDQKRMGNAYMGERGEYQASKNVADNLAISKNLAASPMAGSTQAMQNIGQSQANTLGAATRNATSGSQLLALAGGVQAQADDSYTDLATKQEQDRLQKQQLVMDANTQQADEQRRVFDDHKDAVAEKYSIKAAALQNKYGAIADIGNIGASTGDRIATGDYNGLFSKKKK